MNRLLTFLLMALMTASLYGCGESPSAVAASYFDSCVKGDIAAARASAGGEVAQKLADPQAGTALAIAAGLFEQFGGIERIETSNETIAGESATVLVTMVPKDLSNPAAAAISQPKLVRLSRIDGRWKVVGE